MTTRTQQKDGTAKGGMTARIPREGNEVGPSQHQDRARTPGTTKTYKISWKDHTWRWRTGYRQQRHGTVGTLGAGALGTDSNGTAQLAQLARQEAGDARPILLTEKEVEQEGETCPQAYKNRQNNKNEKQH